MKKTQFIDVIQDIKKNIVSVVSIIIFVALSIGVFFGITWFMNTLNNSYDNYLDEGKVANISYYFAYGASDDDIEKIRNIDGVDEVEGTYISYGNIDTELGTKLCEFRSIGNKLNQIVLKEGNLPSSNNEIVIEESAAEEYNIQVGDVISVKQKDTTSYYLINELRNYSELEEIITLEDEIDDSHYALCEDTFTVCGIVESYTQTINYDHPFYYNELTRTAITFFLNKEAFNLDNVTGYNYVNVYSQELTDIEILSDEYSAAVETLVEKLEPVVNEISENAYLLVKDKGETLLSDYKEKLDDALIQINDGKEKLEDGKEQYNTYLKKISDGEKQLADGKKQLDEGKVQLDEAKDKLDSAYATLINYQNQYDRAKALVDDVDSRYSLVTSQTYFTCNPSDNNATNHGLIENLTNSVCDILDNSTKENVEAKLNNLFASDTADVKTYKTLVDEDNTSHLISRLVWLKQDDRWGSDAQKNKDNAGDYIRGAIVLTYHENLEAIYDDLNDLSALTNETYLDFDATQIKEYLDIILNYIEENGISELLYSNPTSGNDSFIDEVKIIKNYVEVNNYSTKITDAKNLLADKNEELLSGWSQYYSGKALYAEKEELYNTYLKEYNDGLKELEDGKKQLKEAKTKIDDGEIQLADAEEQYQEGLDNYSILEDYLDSVEEVSVVTLYKANSTSVSAINTLDAVATKSRNSFVGLFFVIALLICYNVMTRMINSSIKEIGTKKALGFRRKEILLHYLVVILIILILGFILSFIGSLGIQAIMAFALKKVVQFPMNKLYISIKQILLMFVIYFVIFSLITFISCNTIVNKKAISLLNETDVASKKKHFYEKWKLWAKLPLISKTTINNCFDDSKRVLSTIVGITSCVVLLVSAITVGNNVRNSFSKQFNDYFHFNMIAHFDFDEAEEQLDEVLIDNNLEGLKIYDSGSYLKINGSQYLGKLFVYQTGEDTSDYFNFVSAGDNQYDGKGIWLQNTAKEYLGLNIGDDIDASKVSGEELNGEIAGFVVGHVPSMNIYMDSDTYEQITGEEFTPNGILLNSDNYSNTEIESIFHDVNGYKGITYYKDDVDTAANVYILLTGVVAIVYFGASLVLGFFVILNLLFTLVDQKQKEVIILMINGYTYKQAKKYIYTDTIYLTIISIVLGIIIGNQVGILLVKQLEEAYIMFIHTYDIVANIAAIVLTILLVYLMAHIALKKVDRFRLTELTK